MAYHNKEKNVEGIYLFIRVNVTLHTSPPLSLSLSPPTENLVIIICTKVNPKTAIFF